MTPSEFRSFCNEIGQDTSFVTDDQLLALISIWSTVYEDRDCLIAAILDEMNNL